MAKIGTYKMDIEDAEIAYRNFTGDDDGKKSFNVNIAPENVAELRSQGWNVKQRKELDEDGKPSFYIKIAIRRNSKIFKETGVTETELTFDNVDVLQSAEFETVDLTIAQSPYDHLGNKGISAVLREGYFYVKESRYAEKARKRREALMKELNAFDGLDDDSEPF